MQSHGKENALAFAGTPRGSWGRGLVVSRGWCWLYFTLKTLGPFDLCFQTRSAPPERRHLLRMHLCTHPKVICTSIAQTHPHTGYLLPALQPDSWAASSLGAQPQGCYEPETLTEK